MSKMVWQLSLLSALICLNCWIGRLVRFQRRCRHWHEVPQKEWPESMALQQTYWSFCLSVSIYLIQVAKFGRFEWVFLFFFAYVTYRHLLLIYYKFFYSSFCFISSILYLFYWLLSKNQSGILNQLDRDLLSMNKRFTIFTLQIDLIDLFVDDVCFYGFFFLWQFQPNLIALSLMSCDVIEYFHTLIACAFLQLCPNDDISLICCRCDRTFGLWMVTNFGNSTHRAYSAESNSSSELPEIKNLRLE